MRGAALTAPSVRRARLVLVASARCKRITMTTLVTWAQNAGRTESRVCPGSSQPQNSCCHGNRPRAPQKYWRVSGCTERDVRMRTLGQWQRPCSRTRGRVDAAWQLRVEIQAQRILWGRTRTQWLTRKHVTTSPCQWINIWCSRSRIHVHAKSPHHSTTSPTCDVNTSRHVNTSRQVSM